ncbi:uncharacterized protein LOC135268154 [Aotus nancymaae]|uniref:uncharacterized protein LOC135268154 n=1 Tax=Aotus nancymaae TaxID=37293 RepID=UPI0030FEC94E
MENRWDPQEQGTVVCYRLAFFFCHRLAFLFCQQKGCFPASGPCVLFFSRGSTPWPTASAGTLPGPPPLSRGCGTATGAGLLLRYCYYQNLVEEGSTCWQPLDKKRCGGILDLLTELDLFGRQVNWKLAGRQVNWKLAGRQVNWKLAGRQVNWKLEWMENRWDPQEQGTVVCYRLAFFFCHRLAFLFCQQKGCFPASGPCVLFFSRGSTPWPTASAGTLPGPPPLSRGCGTATGAGLLLRIKIIGPAQVRRNPAGLFD